MIHLLIGANLRQAEVWCDSRLLHRSEIGRHVLSTKLHQEYRMYGLRDEVKVVREEDDGRDFSLRLDSHDRHMIKTARILNYQRGYDESDPRSS